MFASNRPGRLVSQTGESPVGISYRAAFVLYGHAVSDRTESGGKQRARLHSAGLGHQRLRLGDVRFPGDAACSRVWLYGGRTVRARFIRNRGGHLSRLTPVGRT